VRIAANLIAIDKALPRSAITPKVIKILPVESAPN